MDIIELANEYIAKNNLRGRTPVHHCSRWVRITGLESPAEVTTATIENYRRECVALKYSPRSIEGSITDVAMIVVKQTGRKVDIGQRLRVPRPSPVTAGTGSIEAIWPHVPSWVQQWLALNYWTCLRLTDSLKLLREIPVKIPDSLSWRASKTGHTHRWPVPDWLAGILAQQSIVPRGKAYCHLQDKLRSELEAACLAAEVSRILPNQVRKRGLSEWYRASSGAGRVIHGCGLGVLDHYIDPLTILEGVMHKVRLPECFGRVVDSTDISEQFRRLDPQAQEIVSGTIERLVG